MSRKIISVDDNFQENPIIKRLGLLLSLCKQCKGKILECYSEELIPTYKYCPHCGIDLEAK